MACYWALQRTEYLNMVPQGTMHMAPTRNWVLSEPPSHNTGYAPQYAIIKWKWYVRDWAQPSRENTSKLREVAQVSVVSTPAVQLSLSPSLCLWAHGEFPMINMTEADSGLVYRWCCVLCRWHLRLDSCSTTDPLWDSPRRQW